MLIDVLNEKGVSEYKKRIKDISDKFTNTTKIHNDIYIRITDKAYKECDKATKPLWKKCDKIRHRARSIYKEIENQARKEYEKSKKRIIFDIVKDSTNLIQ